MALPYMKWFPRTFRAATAELLPAAELAYRRLLEFLWERGGELPLDHGALARLARVDHRRWPRVWEQIEPFLDVDHTRKTISQKRISEDLERVAALSSQRARFGARGGIVKAQRNQSGFLAKAKQTPSKRDILEDKKVKVSQDRAQIYPAPEEDNRDLHSSSGFFEFDDPEPRPDPVEQAFQSYVGMAVKHGLPVPRGKALSPDRRRKLKLRLDEIGGIEEWSKAIAIVEHTPFLRGDSKNGWRCDLDFLLQPSSLRRVIEGSYGKATGNGHDPKPVEGKVWIDNGSAEWRAWDAYLKRQRGRGMPQSGAIKGWYVDTALPPDRPLPVAGESASGRKGG